ncbi:hypothetical protein EDC61_11427 [Sulfuritortus calidifontis]|uniref:Uncharacterized protein n=1 Tax=Sulfuritortus calidifontis TaxID=1914471 RepID=A0A4R3JTG1_9PROT|nr:hypothetical protein [Sulfuritortus calidifontis]TCS70700.1 hypothetical protein EDC61_11427 [Sulfuritortus calidifontis]
MALRLADIQAVLGCAKSTASELRGGSYRGAQELKTRYEALVAIVEQERRAAALDADAICSACPREDCAGCRIAELI